MSRILIIDDEDLFREDLAALLAQAGHECKTASSGERGLVAANDFDPHIVLCDLVMPGIGGLEVTDKLVATHPDCSVLVVSAHATVDMAIDAFRLGAIDVLVKPIVTEALVNRIRSLEEKRALRANVMALREELAHCRADQEFIGCSGSVDGIRNLIEQVSIHPTPVLITGESGTGKEVIARSIHAASGRTGPFVAVNCVAVAETLFESELFGHSKGAFTGADKTRKGFFEAANGGTLLLDEVGEIPLALQGKLLRAVERREIIRVGEVKPFPVDVRILAATNRDLYQMVVDERFRTNLYYRLRVVTVDIPPLRDRPEDIVVLAQRFVNQLEQAMPVTPKPLSQTALDALSRHTWPGNVRELKNAIERAMIVAKGPELTASDLPREVTEEVSAGEPRAPDNLREAMQGAERAHILHVLRRTAGNKSEAARALGIDPSTLWRKLESDGQP